MEPREYERDPNYYKNQYPATFQQFEQNTGGGGGSNHKNFTTSQFAGNEYQQQSHSKTNSQSDLKQSSSDQLARSKMNNGANFTLQRNSGVELAASGSE